MRRVLVVGSGGAGKTTFARRLAAATGLPLIHLDSIYWRPGWVEPSRDEWARTLEDVIQGARWIFDGNFGGSLELRLEACDTVVFLDVPRTKCVARVLTRVWKGYGRNRAELPVGCPEHFDLAYLWWIWTYPSRQRGELLGKLERSNAALYVLRTDSEIENFLRSSESPPPPDATP